MEAEGVSSAGSKKTLKTTGSCIRRLRPFCISLSSAQEPKSVIFAIDKKR
jgi:hypothetical protein